jgi:hypothetical protein
MYAVRPYQEQVREIVKRNAPMLQRIQAPTNFYAKNTTTKTDKPGSMTLECGGWADVDNPNIPPTKTNHFLKKRKEKKQLDM